MKTFLIFIILLTTAFLTFIFSRPIADALYVSTSGDDSLGNGSKEKPWRTICFAVSKAKEGHTIQLSEGIFTEQPFTIPPGINLEGQGKTRTIIKADPSFFYNPVKPGFSPEKFLIHFTSKKELNGNQYIANLMIDGDHKKLHGGIFINKRNNVRIENVRIQHTNFNGLWFWDTKNSSVNNSELKDCSWGSAAWCNGALNIGNVENVEINNCFIDENTGYGIKGLGPKNSQVKNLRIHHSHVTVNPLGLWNNGTAPNISIELFNLQQSEINHCYVDNHISVSGDKVYANGYSVHIHHNTIDLDNRAQGMGYGLELSINNVEVNNNYFIKGSYAIANWGSAKQHWYIHHNVFYGLSSEYPTDIVRSQVNGLRHVRFHNNTIELTENRTVNLVGIYGGQSTNIEIINNLVLNSNYENTKSNKIIHLENGASITDIRISHNYFDTLSFDDSNSGLMDNVIEKNDVTKSGSKPTPYYLLKRGSKLIDAGLDVGYAYEGNKPDIGAYEFSEAVNY